MAIVDHQLEIEPKPLEDVESFEESVKSVAARRLAERKTAADEPPTTKISANRKDADLYKLKRKSQPKRRKHLLEVNLDLLNKYPNSYFMDVRCRGAGCFFVKTIYTHYEENQICPNCCLTWFVASETPGEPGRATTKCSFWRKTEKFFYDYYYGPLPSN